VPAEHVVVVQALAPKTEVKPEGQAVQLNEPAAAA